MHAIATDQEKGECSETERPHPTMRPILTAKNMSGLFARPVGLGISYGFFGVVVAPWSEAFVVLVLGVDSTVMLLVTLVAPQRLANCVALPL